MISLMTNFPQNSHIDANGHRLLPGIHPVQIHGQGSIRYLPAARLGQSPPSRLALGPASAPLAGTPATGPPARSRTPAARPAARPPTARSPARSAGPAPGRLASPAN